MAARRGDVVGFSRQLLGDWGVFDWASFSLRRLWGAGFLFGVEAGWLPAFALVNPVSFKSKIGSATLPTQAKVNRVAELTEKLSNSAIVISAMYSGMGANQMVDLRRRLRDGSVEFVVVKNNLLHLAADAAGVPQLKDIINGQTAIALGYDDAAVAAKAFADATGAGSAIRVNGAVVNRDTVLPPPEVTRLAALPPQPVLVAQLLGNMQAPLYGLMSVLNGTVRSLAYVLQSRIDQLQPVDQPQPAEAAEAEAVE